ncbi:MotA/TolQ/ExbB proton channel family protein [Desulfotalea psychrophila]|uniref:Related to transport protein TolQ n=1 Tax=Desulfotalea psychrophila (strain LSv54 / DSM 12343) TaxID=177439 RepID=Q6AIX7_DESPS|nr:MotA/TolQ/ExbB proton channel family protein [Desulfotalea psychrophila]CAG37703.1 related to transport protein TolQ [Desulfotalea psychrophila LSv54]
MLRIISLFIVVASCWTLSVPPLLAGDVPWEQTARRVLQLSRDMNDRSAQSARYAAADSKDLQLRLAQLQKETRATEKKLAGTSRLLNQVSRGRAELAEQYEHDMADMKTVEGALRTALRHTVQRLHSSPVSAQHPDRLQALQDLLAQDSFLGLADMGRYTDILFADMRATGGFETKQTQVMGLDGRGRDVSLLRAGGFFLGYLSEGDAAFALANGTHPPLSIPGNSRLLNRELKAWLTGGSAVLPLDITAGAALRAQEQEQGWRQWLEAGGVLLYPILISGLVGFLLTVLKAGQLFAQRPLDKKSKAELFARIRDGQIAGAENILLKISRCPAARVLAGSLLFHDRGLDTLDNVMQEGYLREIGGLERFLSLVGVLASIAPLLGLLGTVTGMINTFQAITIFGTGDPRMMSTGISEALVTTQAGLGIAIPLLLAHHFLKRRIAFLVADIEESGTGMMALLGRD